MQCDVFELTDHVKYVKKEWQNRNRIRTKDDWIWLTVPTFTKNKDRQTIREAMINNANNWQSKHWKSLLLNYRKAPFFKQHEEFFTGLYSRKWAKLIDLNLAIITYLFQELDINVKVIRSSDLDIHGNGTDMIIEMCRKLNAKTYLSGIGGRTYLDEAKFKEHNVTLMYQDFYHPTYRQLFEPFIPSMSIIDVLFNMGNEDSRKIILSSGRMIPAGA